MSRIIFFLFFFSEGSKKENGRQRQLSSELVQEEPGLCNDEGGLFADCRQRSCVRQDSETAERCVNVSRQQLHVQEFRTGPLLCDNIEKFDQKDVKRAQCKGLLKCVQFHKRQLLNAFKVGR